MSPHKTNKKKILLSVIKYTVPYITIVLLLIGMLTHRNLFTILLVIVSVLLVSKLFIAVRSKQKPDPYDWFKSVIKSAAMFSFIYLLYKWLGGYGTFGMFIALLIVVGLIILRQRKLFMDTIREVEVDVFGSTLEDAKRLNK